VTQPPENAPWAPFDPDARCPKCDADTVLTAWHPGTGFATEYGCAAVLLLHTSYPPEHHCRTCQRCHYRWPEAVLEATDAAH
jgi:hypothetical protein